MIDYQTLHIAGGSVHAVPQDVRTYIFGSTNEDNITAEFEWDVTKLPRKVDLRDSDIQNQGGFSSCVGQAISGACEMALGARYRFKELSPLYVYYNSRKVLSDIMHTPVQDTGTSVFVALGTATKLGVAQEVLWPEGTDPNQEPSVAAFADGKSRLIGRYEAVGLDTTQIKRNRLNDVLVAIYCGMPVVFATPLREAFYHITGPLDTHAEQYPKAYASTYDPDYIGNHAMHIVGYDMDKEYFIVENSWGDEWGDKGYWAMKFLALYSCFELFAIREFAGERFEIPEGLRIRKNPIESNYGKAFRLYRAAFGRTPDAAGHQYWIKALDDGYTLSQIANWFLVSPEFHALYGDSPTNEEFATSLYTNVLRRTPDAAGIAWWLERLNEGVPRADVLVGFSESDENKAGALW